MTNEEKQDISAECRRLIAEASKEGSGYRTVAKGKVAEIALAALTAQPVKLPSASEPHSSGYGCAYMVETKGGEWLEKSEVKAAIRIAGYEVQE